MSAKTAEIASLRGELVSDFDDSLAPGSVLLV